MISKCFSTKHLLTIITIYLEPKEICLFQSCNKTIYELLNPKNNSVINTRFYYHTIKTFFTYKDFNEDYYIRVQQYLKEIFWKSNINWKLYFSQILKQFQNFSDKKISNSFLDAFQMHIYLFDLRKENILLEFSRSTYHQIICYDKKFNEKCIYNFYGKYINNNYINNNGLNSNVSILREALPYENELKSFINTYNDIIGNEEYKLIIERMIYYDFEELDKLYEKVCINGINNINNIIFFILWSNRCLIIYCMYIYETISIYEDDKNETKFLEEYNNLYNNYINSCLSINSNFQNINVIVNYLNYFILNNNTEVKFSLYELARSIFNKKILRSYHDKIINKMSLSLINLFNNLFENRKEKEEKDQNETSNTSLCNIELDESFSEYNKEKTNKEIIEDIVGNILDMNINKFNSNAINHSKIKLDKEYNHLEDHLIERLKEALQNAIKEEKPLLNVIKNIEKILKFKKNTQDLNNNPYSFNFINRTKRRMLEESFKILMTNILPKIKKDFKCRMKIENKRRVLYINNKELINKQNCECDSSDLSNRQRMKIEENIEEKIKNIKSCLFSDNFTQYDEDEDDAYKLVDEYMDNNGIEYVFLIKKIIYFYFKEMEIYGNNDQRIYNILSNKIKNEKEYSLNEIFIN